jgi:hypothetical protein
MKVRAMANNVVEMLTPDIEEKLKEKPAPVPEMIIR